MQIFHLFLLKAPLLILLTKSFAESVLKSNHSLFPLGTTSTQNSCFSPNASKSSVASAPVKNASSFFSNSDNSLGSKAFLGQILTQNPI